MKQKKVCMVGLAGVGKTSLVQRYVHSIFSDRYLSTIGVKIDRREVNVGNELGQLLLWDLEGQSPADPLRTSYLNGASGILYVVDGTRRETYDALSDLEQKVEAAIGETPSIVALNKIDCNSDWLLNEGDYDLLEQNQHQTFLTSAKTGSGVEKAFDWLAEAMFQKDSRTAP
jgi:small GTP-binding protein